MADRLGEERVRRVIEPLLTGQDTALDLPLLQPSLQRIVNGGGRIDREYGLGRKRTDLLVQWPLDETRGFLGPMQRVVLN